MMRGSSHYGSGETQMTSTRREKPMIGTRRNMPHITKARFFEACMRQDIRWLRAAAMNPSPAWKSPVWLKLVLLAIRKKGG